jgi:hypothetical protein
LIGAIFVGLLFEASAIVLYAVSGAGQSIASENPAVVAAFCLGIICVFGVPGRKFSIPKGFRVAFYFAGLSMVLVQLFGATLFPSLISWREPFSVEHISLLSDHFMFFFIPCVGFSLLSFGFKVLVRPPPEYFN